MLLRIRREIFKAGEFEQYNETGLLTRDELCEKYHLDRDTTVFYGNNGTLIEGDFVDAPIVVAIQAPAEMTTGFALFLALAALMIGGVAAIAIYDNMPKFGSHKLSYSNSLRGATNPIRKGGQVGILLGEYSVPADVGGLVYSSYSGDDQYIHQLFSVGYGKSVIFKKDDKFKSSGNPDGYVIHMGESPIDTLNDIKVSPSLAYYNKRCVEEGLSLKLTHTEWITRTTPTNTVRIGVGVCAPYGYYVLDDEGEETGTEMHYKVEYRQVGAVTWLSPDNGNVVISSANFEKYRNMVSIPVSRGQYEVRVKRMNEDNPDSRYNDTLMVELMQFDTVGVNGSASPVNHADRYALMSVEVRATDQLNGYLDQIYIDSFLKCRTYNPVTGEWYLPTNPTEVGTMNNPASILLYLLTDPNINPRPLEDSEIDWVSLTEWWKFCNSDKRKWSVNAWITEGITIAELVKNVCMAGRANIHIMDGKYGVLIEDKREDSSGVTIVTQMFTPRNAWDMQEVRSFEKQPDVLTLDFLNQDTGEEESRYLIRQSDGTIKIDEELVNADNLDTESLTLWGVTDPRQVAQLGKYHLATLHARNRTYTWNCALESIVCAVGDVVYLANDVFLYSLGYGRIAKVVKNAGGAVTDVYVDEAMGIEPGKNYGITVRMNDGTFRSIPVSQDKSESYHLIFESPVNGTVEEGNLFMYGDSDKQGKRVVITEIKPDENNGATITAVDYIPELYTIDVNPNQPIPEYQSNINIYGGGQKIGAGGSGRPDFDRPNLQVPSLSLRLSGLTYRYTSKGELSPSTQMITATAVGVGSTSPIHWKINGELLQTQATTIEIPPSYMVNRDFIDIEVSLDAMRVTNTIVRVMDGADYIPVVQYRYSSSKDDPNADSYIITYKNMAITYGNYKLVYGNEDWTATVPIGEKYKDMYLWKRTWSYKLNIWLYERVNDIAVVFEIYPSSYTYPVSKRATVDTEIGFSYRVQGVTGAIAWSTDVGRFSGSTLILPSSIESTSVTVKATYGGLERTLTLEGIVSDDKPIYGGIRDTAPTDKEPIDGDYYMSSEGIPMRYDDSTKSWVALGATDINQSEIMERCGKDWIAHGHEVAKTQSAIYGYFQQLYSDKVVAGSIDTDMLYSKEIKVGDRIVSGGYSVADKDGKLNPDNKPGFYADANGTVKMVRAEIQGTIDSDALTTIDGVPRIGVADILPEYKSFWNHATYNDTNYMQWYSRSTQLSTTWGFPFMATSGETIVILGYNAEYEVDATYSSDGREWHVANFPKRASDPPKGSSRLKGLVYSSQAGVYVAVDGANYSYTSVDGRLWNGPYATGYGNGASTSAGTECLYIDGLSGIAEVNGTFVIIGNVMETPGEDPWQWATRYMTSTDGVHWTKHTFALSDSFIYAYGIRSCNGRFFIDASAKVNTDSKQIITSTDGNNWVVTTNAFVPSANALAFMGVVYFNSSYYLFGYYRQGNTNKGVCLTSTDCTNWSDVSFFSSNAILPMSGCAHDGVFFIGTNNWNRYRTSDGVHWEIVTDPHTRGFLSDMVYAKNMFIGVGVFIEYAPKYSAYDMTNFFLNVIPKVGNPAIALSYEPLTMLQNCSGTVTLLNGVTAHIEKMLASVKDSLYLLLIVLTDGSELIIDATQPLTWPIVIDNLVIENIDAIAKVGNLMPKGNELVSLGTPDQRFLEVHSKQFNGELHGDVKGSVEGSITGEGTGRWVGNVNTFISAEDLKKYQVWGAVAN